MQNKYVGDVGDFGKLQLFRYLFNRSASPFYGKGLAQIWFMHEGLGEENNDGSHIDYFERMMGSDPYLEASLMLLLMRQKREVEELERLKLLPNAHFFYDEVPKAYEDRELWLQKALRFSRNSDIAALAPDNGMALRCLRKEGRFALLRADSHYREKVYPQKYVFADEIARFFTLPNIEMLIVYQHLGRCMPHEKQTEVLLAQLRETYPHTTVIKHKPYSPRLFFFLCKSEIILDALYYRLKSLEAKFPEFWLCPV